MITPILKDLVLKKIVSKRIDLEVNIKCKMLAKELSTEEAFIEAILKEFNKDGLIEFYKLSDSNPFGSFELTAKGIEYSEKTWYEAKAYVEEMQINKLIEEFELIKNQIGLEKYNSIISTLTAIATYFSLELSK